MKLFLVGLVLVFVSAATQYLLVISVVGWERDG